MTNEGWAVMARAIVVGPSWEAIVVRDCRDQQSIEMAFINLSSSACRLSDWSGGYLNFFLDWEIFHGRVAFLAYFFILLLFLLIWPQIFQIAYYSLISTVWKIAQSLISNLLPSHKCTGFFRKSLLQRLLVVMGFR